MKILVINAGSSSLKYQLINILTEEVLAKGNVERIGIEGSVLKHLGVDGKKIEIKNEMSDHSQAIALVLKTLIDPKIGVIKSMKEISAIGHRVVHGGEYFDKSVIITDSVKEKIRKCIDLAPLHNPAHILGIEACERAMPGVPQVAVFDTAFHQTMPKKSYLYPIPRELYDKYKIRRYGMHGTSHKYVALKAAEFLGKPLSQLKLITAHLGNGSSITAIQGGKSIDTSMGFTPLAGVMMGTRSGDIDPAIVTFLIEKGMTSAEINDMLNKKSGLLAISGIGSDFRDVGQAYLSGDEDAKLALYMFAYQVKKYIGAYIAAMGGVDALIFTAGVGEYNPSSRRRITEGLEHLGIIIDQEINKERGVMLDISDKSATVKTLVIPTNEELMIARDTQELISKLNNI
ncbi:MAG: acetate kinase [Clostridiales bacterium]|jgi:acetate kinase|nr:acetate kinase [Clostridiales bacterium]